MNKNILNKILLATLPFMAINANAATPQSFNYQSVVRSTSGVLVANETVFIKVEILRETVNSAELIYSEMHHATTNANGSFVIKVGRGTASSGSFGSIDWSNGKFTVKTYTSLNSDLTDAAEAQTELSSVPFALYSLKSADSFSGRWNDLTGKPEMSEYAKIEDVAGYTADSTRKILADYATKDDVEDLYNRALRTSNYRIDSLKSVTVSNNYWISELQALAAKYATKSEVSSFVKKDTLSTYATKASVAALSKSTNEAVAELSQTVKANKELSEATFNNMTEIHKLYAKKDTLDLFMLKSAASNFAPSEAVETLSNSVSSLSQTINSTDTRLSGLTTTVSDLSATVESNKKEANQKIEAAQTELSKVDDKIASSERKAKADDLVLENRIAATEKTLSTLTSQAVQLGTEINSKLTAMETELKSADKKNATAIDSLAKVTTANATAASKNTKSKIDSLAKAIDEELAGLSSSINSSVEESLSGIGSELTNINSTLSSQSSTIGSLSTSVSNINSTMTSVVNWAQKVNTKNDSLSKELTAIKNKYKEDSLRLEKRIYEDSLKAVAKYNAMLELAKDYMKAADQYKTTVDNLTNQLGGKSLNEYVSDKIAAALSEAGLAGLSTKVDGLDGNVTSLSSNVSSISSDVNDLKTTVGTSTSGLVKRVGALENSASIAAGVVSDLSSDVTTLKATVGSNTSGLVKEVNDLDTRVTTLESK